MKKNIVFIGAALILFMVQACGVLKNKNPTDLQTSTNIYDKKWKLIELNGTAVADKVNNEDPFITFDSEAQRYAASAGCNVLGGSFSIKNNEIKFSQGMSTLMACTDMTLEESFKTIFGKTLKFEIQKEGDNDLLTLKDGHNTVAKFTNNPSVSSATLSGTWELDYISGPRITFSGLYPDKKPTIQFDLENSRIHGTGSCNNYNATVELDNQNIKVGPIAATKMMCPHIQGEQTFFQTLDKIDKYSVNGNQLTLIMGDIAMMRFKKL